MGVAHDKDIREGLFDFLEETYGKIRILEEKRTGNARADVVMVTPDALFGIEIKSDNDTYTRLAGQVENYNLYYDRNVICVGSSHAAHIAEHVPDFWGIITVEYVEGKLDFYYLRQPQSNPFVEDERKITILWRPEIASILALNGLPLYNYKSKQFVRRVLLERIPKDVLWMQVCEELFERDYTTIADRIMEYRKERNPGKRMRKKRGRYSAKA